MITRSLSRKFFRFPYEFDNNKTFVCRGYQLQYQFVRNYASRFQNHQFFLFNKPIVDLAFYFVQKQKARDTQITPNNLLTYISEENFQTISCQKVNPEQNQHIKELWVNDQYGDFIKNHKFYVHRTFSVKHPFSAYKTVCGYLKTQHDQSICSLFFNGAISTVPINQTKPPNYARFLKSLQNEHIDQDYPLKLRLLPRKKPIDQITQQERDKGFQQWRQITGIDILQNLQLISVETRFKQMQWILKNKAYKKCRYSELVQGYGQRQFYAEWKKKVQPKQQPKPQVKPQSKPLQQKGKLDH